MNTNFKSQAISIYKLYYKLRHKVPEPWKKKYLLNLRATFIYSKFSNKDFTEKLQLLKEAEENYPEIEKIFSLPPEYLQELENIKL
jgi:hypothetical protein